MWQAGWKSLGENVNVHMYGWVPLLSPETVTTSVISYVHMWSFAAVVSDSLQPYELRPPGSSVHGTLQAGILEWVAMPSFRGSSQPRDQTRTSGFFILWATWEALLISYTLIQNTKFKKMSAVRLGGGLQKGLLYTNLFPRGQFSLFAPWWSKECENSWQGWGGPQKVNVLNCFQWLFPGTGTWMLPEMWIFHS